MLQKLFLSRNHIVGQRHKDRTADDVAEGDRCEVKNPAVYAHSLTGGD